MGAAIKSETLAIDGGAKVHERGWPAWPEVSEQEWAETVEPALRAVYLSRVEGLPSPRSYAFAKDWAAFCGAGWGVMTPHGTDALMAAVAGALDLDGLDAPGEVIMPSYTFIASASAALAVRCQVAFADIDPVSHTLDPAAVEALIGPNTVALMPVHLGGHPAPMDRFRELAEKHGLALIEDCAQAHGAAWQGQRVGSWGDAAGFSFQSSKNLTSGEGGCVTTISQDIFERVVSFVDVGRRPGGERWEYPRLGWNYRPSEYLAALLSCRLALVEPQLRKRSDNAAYLTSLLEGLEGLEAPAWSPGCTQHAYHLYMMRYDPAAFGGHSRDEFVRALCAEGVPAWIGYGQSLDQHEALRRAAEQHPEMVRCGDLPVTTNTSARSVWLGQGMLLAEPSDLDDVAEAALKIKRAWTS